MKKILQVFKRDKKTYVCDPYKNRKCIKAGCWDFQHGPCKCTANKKFAKRDADGKPIIARDEDLYNEEYLDYLISIQLKDEAPDIYDGVVN